jgi:tetratricopeptide (TPR) repeat protein
MSELPTFKIFLSSPGDVAEERALAEFVFQRLSDELADVAQLSFLIWEHEPLFGHTGFQQQLERPSQSDLVVIILWSRLGTRLPADYAPVKGEQAPTGTEFEINDSLTSYAARGKPNLLIYRKMPGPQIGLGSKDFEERSEQYRRLDEYCRRTFYDEQGATTVAHHLFAASQEFERKLAMHLRRWVDQELHLPQSEKFRPFWRGESPFRGLQAFDAEHQAIYYGRSEALSDLTRRIRDIEAAASLEPVARLLLVQGMSGSGKTSLFKAGLLPRLMLRPVEGIGQWITLEMRPSESDPALRDTGALGVLASMLIRDVPALASLGSTAQLAEELFSQPQAATSKIERAIAANAAAAGIEASLIRLLIYFDQLEEAFSNPAAGIGEAPLIAAIVALSHSSSIWVAATIRSDFVHRLEAYPELMQVLSHSPSYTLLPPRPDELAEMIREPARAAGLVWEERDGMSLDKELLRDATGYPEALPLLEYTLAKLYERRDGRTLRWAEYGGGLRDALISTADEVVGDIDTGVDIAFRDVMRELVGVSEDGAVTRRYASLSRFPEGTAARDLLDRLVARRLCVTTDEGLGDGPVTSLAHEALIRSWPRAQEWLQRETALLRVRDELARDAAAWEHHGRTDGWLGVAPEKIAAIRQVEDAGLMPAGATDYARQSRRRRQRNRFVRRAVMAGICTLSVVAGIAAWLALKQRDVARTEAATSDRTTQFMVGLFQLADPSENRGNAITVKEVLDKGAKDIREGAGAKSLSQERRVRTELLTAMGQAYSGLGLYKPAEELLTQARADSESSTVSDEVRVRALYALGHAMYLAGNYEPAETTLRKAVELARKNLEPSDDLRSTTLTTLADVSMQLGDFPKAIGLCNEALVADRKRSSEHDNVLAETLATLGSAQFFSGDLQSAETTLRETLEIRKRFFGMHHALTAITLNDLGVLQYQAGRYDAALQTYQQALPIEREIYGQEHPEVATTLSNIGRSMLMAGQVSGAEPLLRQSLAMTQKFEGDTHADLVSPLNSLAMIDAYNDRLDTAVVEIQRADAIARLPDHDELLDQVILNEANVELTRGNHSRAEALLAESKDLLEKSYPDIGKNAWRYAVWDATNAQLLAAKGDVAGAEQTLSAAQAIIVQRFGENGFYNLLAKRRASLIAKTRRST